MQSFVALCLCAAVVCSQFLISHGRPAYEEGATTGNAGTGIAAFPLKAFRSSQFVSHIQALVKRFNQLAGSDNAYILENVPDATQNPPKSWWILENQPEQSATLVGRVLLIFDDGRSEVVDKVLVNNRGHVLKPGTETALRNVLGIVGGNERRVLDLPEETLHQIKKGLYKYQAILNYAPGDFWVIGTPYFGEGIASVDKKNPKIIQDLNKKSPIEKAVDAARMAPEVTKNLLSKGIDLVVGHSTKTFAVVGQGVKDTAKFAGDKGAEASAGIKDFGSNVVKGGSQMAKSGVEWVGSFGKKKDPTNDKE